MMKSNIFKHSIGLIVILIFHLHLTGCASLGPTQPNIPFAGNPHPSIFINIYQNNPLLVEEIGKLPELQDGISVDEKYALEKLVEIYGENPNDFNKVFEEMYQIGLPDVRKYCSSLQALFWLVEDGKLDDSKDILKDYSLGKLLGTAWELQPKPIPFSDEQIARIIDNTEDIRVQEVFSRNKNDKEYIQRVITDNFKYQPRIFNRQARAIIKEMESENEDEDLRWENFDLVIDRLNSPELLDYYERHVISYKNRCCYGEGPEEARNVFNDKVGHCAQITAFTVYVLQKAGYEARRYIVAGRLSPRGNYHRATLFIVKGKKYIMDNGRKRQIGIVRFEDYGDSTSREKDARLQGEPMLYPP